MATIKPQFPGYGTPFLTIYDRNGVKLIDEITLADGSNKPLSLGDFSYTFNETDDDMGTVVINSNSPDFMDSISLRHRGVLYLEWGYLNGDRRPRLKVLIRNLKQRYDINGYSLILELSDNYAPAKTSKSPTQLRLEEVLEGLNNTGENPENAEKIAAFLDPIPKYDPAVLYLDLANTPEETGDVYVDPMSAGESGFSPWHEGAASSDQEYSPKPKKVDFLTNLPEASSAPGTLEYLTDLYLSSLPDGGVVPTVVATNTAEAVQEILDKMTGEPVVVTGADGKVKIFKRRRVSLFPPITEYTFRGGDGRLLDFNYDTDSDYSDDSTVLRTLRVDPETGKIEIADLANTLKKLVDVTNPYQNEQMRHQEIGNEYAWSAALKGKSVNDLNNPNTTIVEFVSNPMLIQWGGTRTTHAGAIGDSSRFIPGGQGYNMAMDNTAKVTQFRSLPISRTNDAKELIENELKNLKSGDTFRNRANARTIGDPSISNGVNITLKGLSKKCNGVYHITSCTHTIGSSGYTNNYEMYKVSDIPVGVDIITHSTTNASVKTTLQEKKESLEDISNIDPELKALWAKRGYLLPQDLNNKAYVDKMNAIDKDWVKKLGYTDYIVKYNAKIEGVKHIDGKDAYETKQVRIRVPNDPRSPGTRIPLDSMMRFDELHKIIGDRWMKARIASWTITPEDPNYRPKDDRYTPKIVTPKAP